MSGFDVSRISRRKSDNVNSELGSQHTQLEGTLDIPNVVVKHASDETFLLIYM